MTKHNFDTEIIFSWNGHGLALVIHTLVTLVIH